MIKTEVKDGKIIYLIKDKKVTPLEYYKFRSANVKITK